MSAAAPEQEEACSSDEAPVYTSAQVCMWAAAEQVCTQAVAAPACRSAVGSPEPSPSAEPAYRSAAASSWHALRPAAVPHRGPESDTPAPRAAP